MKTICIITPTIGRPTLARALASGELAPGDEWIVVGDGPQPEAEQVVNQMGPQYRYVEGSETRNRGNEQRDLGMSLASADYLLFLDDDDVFTPGAIGVVHGFLEDLPRPMPIIFRMHHNGHIIWQSQELWPGEVGGCMFCLPNVPGKLGRWAGWPNEQTSDLEFIKDTLRHYGRGDLLWSGNVIVRCNPERI